MNLLFGEFCFAESFDFSALALLLRSYEDQVAVGARILHNRFRADIRIDDVFFSQMGILKNLNFSFEDFY